MNEKIENEVLRYDFRHGITDKVHPEHPVGFLTKQEAIEKNYALALNRSPYRYVLSK